MTTIDTAALRALAEEAAYRGDALYVEAATVLALLDENERLRGVMVSLASYIETMPDEYASKADIARQLRAALEGEGR